MNNFKDQSMFIRNSHSFVPKNKKLRKLLYKLYFISLLRKIVNLGSKIVSLKLRSEEAMGLLFRRNFQLTVLDTLNTLNNASYASEIQSAIPIVEGEKKASLGAVVMSLSRLQNKGFITILSAEKGKSSMQSNRRRKYTITLTGKVELDKYYRFSERSSMERKYLMPETANSVEPIPLLKGNF